MKNPLTPAGIESATVRFVAQHLNLNPPRNQGLVKISRHTTEHFVHELALAAVRNERFINTWHCRHLKTAVYLNKELCVDRLHWEHGPY